MTFVLFYFILFFPFWGETFFVKQFGGEGGLVGFLANEKRQIWWAKKGKYIF
jgi:hypothetical protein